MRVSPCAWVMDCGFCARTGMTPSTRACDFLQKSPPSSLKVSKAPWRQLMRSFCVVITLEVIVGL